MFWGPSQFFAALFFKDMAELEYVDQWVSYDKENDLYHIKVGNMSCIVGSDWYKDFVKELKRISIDGKHKD